MGYLTASEAAAALGVTLPTLYAYASRGQLRSETAPGQPRERRYSSEDIERLRERKEVRRDPSRAAARGLHWGSPVLESGLTLIQDGRLYYRGRDAVKMAQQATLDEAAELLWLAPPGETARWFRQRHVLSASRLAKLRPYMSGGPMPLLQAALALAGSLDLPGYDLRPEGVRMTGARIVRVLTSALAGRHSDAPVHSVLDALWAPRNGAARDALRVALVLSADHELNASTFVARCAASAGASPYDVVSAALATLKGHRHGGATERLAALFAEAETTGRVRGVLAERLRRGEQLPGFGHPLYPAGDPRAQLLLEMAKAARNSISWQLTRQLAKAGGELLQAHPNLDFGLVALARAYGLPEHAPIVLFALGRTIGWIGHAIEQYASSELIRPRARYNGPAPEAD